MDKFYWYKRGGFILAVDAMSRRDADNYVRSWNGEMEYLGYYGQGTQYTTACNGVTSRRQDEISRNLTTHPNPYRPGTRPAERIKLCQ